MLATFCILITLIRSSSAYPFVRHCKVQEDCYYGEFCKNQQECECLKDFVRKPGGACLALRRAGETCSFDRQCSGVDARLVCYHGRCQCPNGIEKADGTCPRSPPATPSPASESASSEEPRKVRSAERDEETLSPTLVILLVFLSLVALLLTSIYRVRVRRRTGMAAAGVRGPWQEEEEERSRAGGARRVSLTTIVDEPPSYSSLPPPSYEQATQQAALMVQSTEGPLGRESCVEEPLAGSSSSYSILALTPKLSSGSTSLSGLLLHAEESGTSQNRERY